MSDETWLRNLAATQPGAMLLKGDQAVLGRAADVLAALVRYRQWVVECVNRREHGPFSQKPAYEAVLAEFDRTVGPMVSAEGAGR